MTKRKAIIVDIDGTLADSSSRAHFAMAHMWDEFYAGIGDDPPHQWCVEIVKMAHTLGWKVFFITGRQEQQAVATLLWLRDKSGVPADLDFELYMRPAGDDRKDDLVKEDIYKKHVEPGYDVVFAIDDRERIIEMWRRLGLVALQCAEGKF